MALMWNAVNYLCDAYKNGLRFDDVLTIGRSQILLDSESLAATLDHFEIAADPQEFRRGGEPPHYAESLFRWLGARHVDAIDASDYEGANVIADLNDPIPEPYRARYDLVYDSGALEHIFNVPQVLKNYMEMARVGGSVIIETFASNLMGHGLYQFSPELFYRVFSPENGFRVVRTVVFEYYSYSPFYDVPDPSEVRSRIELCQASWDPIGIIVQAERTAAVPIFQRWPQQSDYLAVWESSAGDDPARSPTGPVPPTAPSLKRRLLAHVKGRLPGLVSAKHRLARRYPRLAGYFYRPRRKTLSFSAQPDRFREGQRSNG
jgi:hypothetical protein